MASIRVRRPSLPSLAPLAVAALLALLLGGCSSSSSTLSPAAAEAPPVQRGSGGPSLSVLAAGGSDESQVHWDQFSCSSRGVLALRSDGSIWGWGSTPLEAAYSSSSVPSRITQDSDWVRVATGSSFGTAGGAIKADGSLWTWGSNFCGLLGRDVPDQGIWGPWAGYTAMGYYPFYPPTPVGGNDWKDLSIGANHAMAIKTDGTLWGWGLRTDGRLGNGSNIPSDPYSFAFCVQHVPVRIGTDADWAEVQVGACRTVARKVDGSLWEWGTGASLVPVRAGLGTDRWGAFSVGDSHVLAIRQSDNSLWAWGWNEYGQLGTGGTDNSDAPGLVAAGPWKAVGAGTYHSLAVKGDGTLWSFGDNHAGKLGDGSQRASLVPVQVGTATDWAAAAAGEEFSAALKEKQPDGKLWLWGENDAGQLGNGLTASVAEPARVDPALAWSGAFPGGATTFALRPDGTLWGWGANGDGELGDGTAYDRQLPGRVGSDTGWTAVAPGYTHTLALRSDGSLWSWGGSTYGELGTGGRTDRPLPGRVGTERWRSVAAAWMASFAVREDGTLWAWGLDAYNRLGLGHAFTGLDPVPPPDTVPVPDMFVLAPTQVGSDGGWKQVSASGTQTAAVKDDGSLWAWGTGAFGALGNGLKDTGVPSRVGTDNDWAFVATSGFHMAGLKTDGSLWAWGTNAAGQLGDGSHAGRDAPVRIGADLWRSVAVRGDGRTAAVRRDGTLWEWGGVEPKAPDQPATGSNVPVQVGSSSRWVSVHAGDGGAHWAALESDGTLYTWGGNWYGQLGNRAAWSPEPVWIP